MNLGYRYLLAGSTISSKIRNKSSCKKTSQKLRLCEICENASLMAKAVRKRKNAHPTNVHDIVERYSCNSKNISCIANDCAECRPEKIRESWDASSDESESNSDSDEEVDTITFST